MIGKPNREGFGNVTPYLILADAQPFKLFLEQAFGAAETYRTLGAGGGFHIEFLIGDSRIMVGETGTTGQPTNLFLYVADARSVFQAAIASGAQAIMEPEEGRFGEQVGAAVRDPAGNSWFIGEHGPGSTTS